MKIAILSREPNNYSTGRLVQSAKDRGHQVDVLDTLRCYMNINPENLSIHYKGAPVIDYDAIIPRIGARITFYGTAVIRQFEMMGVYSVNDSIAISRSRDKLRCLQLLARHGIGLPTTGFAHETKYIEDLMKMVGEAPLVIKLLEGTQGIGVVLAETSKAAESVIEAFRSLEQNILVQEFIKESGGSDIRCFVVGDKVVASMERKGKPGDFRSNLHRGGRRSGDSDHARRTKDRGPIGQGHGAQCGGRRHSAFEPRPLGHGGKLFARLRRDRGLYRQGCRGKNHRIHRNQRKTQTRFLEGIMPKKTAFSIGDVKVAPGSRATVNLPVARLYTHTSMDMPVHVINGRRQGPCLFVSAAIHGDEINGVEIIRRLHHLRVLRRLRGTLITIPIVNIFGFIHHSRYLPDRRDLNRAFPGKEQGSLASRLANLFTREIVSKCTHGIDLHTGSNHRVNFPHIRACLEDPETHKMASAFGAPVVLDSNLRDGSLRQSLVERKVPVLLYEAGEALRFDETSIRVGLRGIVSVMRLLEMLPEQTKRTTSNVPWFGSGSAWVRAPSSGILVSHIKLGSRVAKGELLGKIYDPFGEKEAEVRSNVSGIPVGMLKLPLVYQGDALYHIAVGKGELPDETQFEEFLPDEPYSPN